MRVAVVGYGMEGIASFEYFTAKGHEVTICDQNTALVAPAGASTQLGDSYLDDLGRFDLVIRTAGMHPKIILEKNPDLDDKLSTQLNEFLKACPTEHVIGITGTKGKGTTTTLTFKMLEAAGYDVHLGGNIGIPLFSFIDELTADSWVVLELSSFQLIDVQRSPHIATCLMIVPEHLNWHADMDEYVMAKSRLFARQTPDDVAIYFADSELSRQVVSAGESQKVPYYAVPGAIVENDVISIDGQTICRTDELQLLGRHNWQNVCAAVTTIWQAGMHDIAAMRSVLTTFSGLPYHLELIRELHGVSYYNDGFSTTPETAMVAIQTFSQPKIVILGGSDKGIPFDDLAEVVKTGNVKHVVLIGNSTNEQDPTVSVKLAETLRQHGVTNITSLISPGGPSMEQVVSAARLAAEPGDIVLLSTGCASFDMFNNYKERAAAFTTAVNALS